MLAREVGQPVVAEFGQHEIGQLVGDRRQGAARAEPRAQDVEGVVAVQVRADAVEVGDGAVKVVTEAGPCSPSTFLPSVAE